MTTAKWKVKENKTTYRIKNKIDKMLIFIIIYSVIGVLNGLWSLKMQKKYHPKFLEWWRMIFIFVINSIFWWVTIPWAAINKQLW